MTKRVHFLYDLVVGEFHESRTIGRDERADALTRLLAEKTERKITGFLELYGEAVTYTVSLSFEWPEGAPDSWRAFETWWEMRQSDEVAAFKYYVENVDNLILLGKQRKDPALKTWKDAVEGALEVWTPPREWKLLDELPPEEQRDPLSSPNTGESDPT